MARLDGELKAAHQRIAELEDDYATCLEELNKSRRLAMERMAERDRLREALAKIERKADILSHELTGSRETQAEEIEDIARAAINQTNP